MNRRAFLRTAGAAIAAMGIDPELLVWQPRQMVAVPAAKTITLVEWAHGMPVPDNVLEAMIRVFNQENKLLEDLFWVPTFK